MDNGSVYTKSILNFLKEAAIDFRQAFFDKVTGLDFENYSSFILSGRRQNNSAMNAINSRLIKYAFAKRKPLLGICYGAEILALTLGGTIKRMAAPRQGIEEIDVIQDNPLCSEKIRVFESHSYKVERLDSSFKQIAKSSICEFEIFQHDNQNIFGTQFHPEMSRDGQVLLKNFSLIK